MLTEYEIRNTASQTKHVKQNVMIPPKGSVGFLQKVPFWIPTVGMAISGYPMSRLDVIGKVHGHETIYYFIKETETAPLIVSLQVYVSLTGAAMK